MHVTAIVAAGGRGERFGGAVPKQLLTIGGRAILERSVSALASHPSVDDLIVALPVELVADPPPYLSDAAWVGKPVRLVPGGPRRQDSVANAFRAISGRTEVVVIHDAARPFVSGDLISRTIAAAAESGAAVAALQARDTVKLVRVEPRNDPGALPFGAGASGGGPVVSSTLPRRLVFLAQTPQAFRCNVLREALALAMQADAEETATDEASLAERAGHPVRLVEGDVANIKITTPEDLAMAEAIVRSGERDRGDETFDRQKPARTGRAGIGYDLHRLVAGCPLVLGGVTIPFERGLAGHSDADALCHAIIDAVLGAAGAGDIGRHFPDTDPQWQGASSLDLLRRAAAMVRERGLEVGNVDASVIAERPKLVPYIDAMRANIAGALGMSIDRVSVKGKTNEGVGELGRGEAIAVHAIALLRAGRQP
jgi:2-C-methyl-D-erythritol 4-phosphate cytidylyltransferase / 2-C-methyl-D-erythritol 2,4-cyclodiphosphate synthase